MNRWSVTFMHAIEFLIFSQICCNTDSKCFKLSFFTFYLDCIMKIENVLHFNKQCITVL